VRPDHQPLERTALVSGAGRGIGRAIAVQLARQGRDVAVHYRRSGEDSLALVQELRVLGVRAEAFAADLSSPSEVDRLAGEATEALGPVTILVNNASSFRATPFEEADREAFLQALEVHLLAPAALARALLPGMKAAGWGRIVNMGDMMVHAPAPPRYSAHVAAKAALVGLTRALAEELGPLGVTVNCISPAVTKTPSTLEMPASVMEKFARHCPVGRAAEPDEVAAVAAFLCSEEASFVNGAEIPVSGGWRYL
jgi:3-oxoacyl-[acyl-carrier protein] reductase